MSEPETNRTHYPTEHASAVKTVSGEFGLSFSGYHSPLPPPNVLEEYKAIDPAILTLILDMSVKEQEHRHRAEIREIEIVAYSRQMEDRAIKEDFRFGGRGQWIAFALACVFLGLFFFLAYLRMETALCVALAAGSVMALSKFFAPRFLVTDQDDKKNAVELPVPPSR